MIGALKGTLAFSPSLPSASRADPLCAADRASLAQLATVWFSLNPGATAKSPGGVSAAFRRAGRGTVNRFEVTVKPAAGNGAWAYLCVNIPAADANKCKTLRELCGGARCGANFTTGRFKIGKKLQTCCVSVQMDLGGEPCPVWHLWIMCAH